MDNVGEKELENIETYDEKENLVSIKKYDENKLIEIINYEYNEEGTLDCIKQFEYGDDNRMDKKVETKLEYNEDGLVRREISSHHNVRENNKILFTVDKEYDNTAGTYKEQFNNYEYNEDGSFKGVHSSSHEGIGKSLYNREDRSSEKAESKLENNKEEPLEVPDKSNNDSNNRLFENGFNFGKNLLEKFRHTIEEIRDGINPILSEIKEIIQEMQEIQKEKNVEKEEQGRTIFD